MPTQWAQCDKKFQSWVFLLSKKSDHKKTTEQTEGCEHLALMYSQRQSISFLDRISKKRIRTESDEAITNINPDYQMIERDINISKYHGKMLLQQDRKC